MNEPLVQLRFEELLEEERAGRLRAVAEDWQQAIDPARRMEALLEQVRTRMAAPRPVERRRRAG